MNHFKTEKRAIYFKYSLLLILLVRKFDYMRPIQAGFKYTKPNLVCIDMGKAADIAQQIVIDTLHKHSKS